MQRKTVTTLSSALKHESHFSRWTFCSKKIRVKYDQYLAERPLWKPHPQADIHIGLPRQMKQYAE